MKAFRCALGLLIVSASAAGAQCVLPMLDSGGFVALGSAVEDRLNLARLRGCASSTLLRSPTTLSDSLVGDGLQFDLVPPTLRGSWNSRIPFSLNDGSRWAGRGASATLSGGFRFRWRAFHATVAPEVVSVENRLFQVIPSPSDTLDPFSTPLHARGFTIDAPLRFGARPFTTVFGGQSSIEVRAPFLAAGASTENLWWGAGIRTGILMSNNAAGIPQVYLRTSSPVHTPLGIWEARALLGVLTESRFFDQDETNDRRSFSGAVATVRPFFDTTFVLGAARVMFATLPGLSALPRHAADFALTLGSGGSDEMTSLFGEWAFVESGLALHWEWARLRLPSLREFLVAPQRRQGYTIGVKWARPVLDEGTLLRIQTEFTMLEQSLPPSREYPLTFYPSRRVPQGYTQFGQVIGAGSGPGSSSQWLAADLFRRQWNAGVSAGRIRWENEAYYFQPVGITGRSHDVSVFAGVKGARFWDRWSLEGELIGTRRLNYLFQTGSGGFFFDSTFDMPNVTFNVELAYRR